jgi:hypothetical protein
MVKKNKMMKGWDSVMRFIMHGDRNKKSLMLIHGMAKMNHIRQRVPDF